MDAFILGVVVLFICIMIVLVGKGKSLSNKPIKIIFWIIAAVLLAIILRLAFYFAFERLAPIGEVTNGLSNMDSQLIKMRIEDRNQLINSLVGKDKSGSEANYLLFQIEQLNNNEEQYVEKIGKINLTGITDRKLFNFDSKYSISIIDYYDNGLIKTVEIVEQ